MTKKLSYPQTRIDSTEDEHFGERIADPYRWLEDGKSAEVCAWTAAQDALTRKWLAGCRRRPRLAARFREILYAAAIGEPVLCGGRVLYAKRLAQDEQAAVYLRLRDGSAERKILDPAQFDPAQNAALGVWAPSPDGAAIAYTIKPDNADNAALCVRDVERGEDLPGEVIRDGMLASPQWTPAGDGFYYIWLPPPQPGLDLPRRLAAAEVRLHALGSEPARDRVVMSAIGDPHKYYNITLSRDGRWLFVYVCRGWSAADVYYQDTRSPERGFEMLINGRDAGARVTAWDHRFFILTDADAPHAKILAAPCESPRSSAWESIVPERADVAIESMRIIGGRLMLNVLRQGLPQIEVWEPNGRFVSFLDSPASAGRIGARAVAGCPEEDEAVYSFSSLTAPPVMHLLSMNRRTFQLWGEQSMPVRADDYEVRQEWCSSRDGTRVPMLIVLPRCTSGGPRPFLLTAYGGFGYAWTPRFDPSIFPWLEAGGGYAAALVRGGGEFGEGWHRAGMLERKQNVFDDFIAAGEHLIRSGGCRPDSLSIRGASNGGLLVGAALTQRPDLFRAAVCEVPLLDMLRYHLSGAGRQYVLELGSADTADQYRALIKYSPYHRVKSGAPYPAVLLCSADSDERVSPMHARKMAAALQRATSSPAPILLKIDAAAGHNGYAARGAQADHLADVFAFLMQQAAISEELSS